MEVDICYIVSHGFAGRMLMQTDLIGKLLEKGHHVAILSHNARDENFRVYAGNPKFTSVQWQEKNTIWDDDYLYKRMYFLEDIGKNVALKEKFFNALLYSKSKHPWKRIRPLFYYAIYKLVKVLPGIREWFLKKESKHLVSKEAENIIRQLNPRLLVSTYPVSIMEAKMLYEAKLKNVPTLLHLLSWDNISCKGQFPVLADRFIAWGKVMEQELQEYYKVPSEKIATCGVPHFDEHIRVAREVGHREFIRQLGLDPEKPYLFFAMSSPRFAPREIDIVIWLAENIEKGVFGENLQLVVRPHPQNVKEYTAKESWLARLEKLNSARVCIDLPLLIESQIRWSMKKEDMVRLSGLLSGCCVCINSGSTVSIDALMHNKPVILTSFDGDQRIHYWNSARRLKDYAHLKKFISQGGARTVGSFIEMQALIMTYLDEPEKDLVIRRNALLNACFKDDGQSTLRVAQVLDQCLNTTNR